MNARRHPRLKGYDYSQNGGYFVTFCTKNRVQILSRIVGRGFPDAPQIELTSIGETVRDAIGYLEDHTDGLSVEHFVIMPNHVHLLLTFEGASGMPRPTNMQLPRFMSSLKRYTNRICGRSLWQTSYHDHVIRDENDFLSHWHYIESNPAKWQEDEYYGGKSSMPATTTKES